MKYRIFISSVQKEFAAERRALKKYLLTDPLLSGFVESVFVFEDQPAAKKRPGEIYLSKLVDTDIYIGLFGSQYGNRVPKGELSPTEQEYDAATAAVLYQARYIEHVGSGIEDVEAACAEAGLPRTTIEVRNRTIVHTIWRKTTKETGKTSKKTSKKKVETSKKTSKKTGQIFLLPDGLSDAARKIAETMLSNPHMSAKGAAELLGLTQQGVQYHLAKLTSVIHHEGGDRNGRWVFGPKPNRRSSVKGSIKSSVKTVDKSVDKNVDKSVDKTSEDVFNILKTNPRITLDQVAKAIGFSVRGVEQAVKRLRIAKRIKKVGGKKLGHWEVTQTIVQGT